MSLSGCSTSLLLARNYVIWSVRPGCPGYTRWNSAKSYYVITRETLVHKIIYDHFTRMATVDANTSKSTTEDQRVINANGCRYCNTNATQTRKRNPSFINSLSECLTASPLQRLTDSLPHGCTVSCTHCLIASLPHWLTTSPPHWLIHHLIASPSHCLTASPFHWPTDRLTHYHTETFIHSLTHSTTDGVTHSVVQMIYWLNTVSLTNV